MKRNILVIIGYPLQVQIDRGDLDVLMEMIRNQLNFFDEVHIYSPRDNRAYSLGKNIFVHPGGGAGIPRLAAFLLDVFNVINICRKNNISLMRTVPPHTAGAVAYLSSRLTMTPYICLVDTDRKLVEKTEGLRYNPLISFALNFLERKAYQKAILIPYISAYIKNYAISMGAPETKLFYHPNFVNSEHFKPKEKWSNNPSKLVFVGRLEKIKGVEYLIEALPKILKEHEVSLTICGKGSRLEELRELVKNMGVADRVLFKGNVAHLEELPAILRESDIFVSPLTGGFTIMESMAVGLPIIVGDKEWVREAIVDGENGFVIKEKNSDAIAEAVLKLLKNPVLLRTISKNNIAKSRQLFSLENYKKREMEIYSRVLLC